MTIKGTDKITAYAFTEIAVLGYHSGIIGLLNTATGHITHKTLSTTAEVTSISIIQPLVLIAVSYSSGQIISYDRSLKKLQYIQPEIYTVSLNQKLEFHNACCACLKTSTELSVFQVSRTGYTSFTQSISTNKRISDFKFNRALGYLLIVTFCGEIMLTNTTDWFLHKVLSISNNILKLAFDPSGLYMSLLTQRNEVSHVEIYELGTTRLFSKFTVPNRCNSSIEFSSDGKLLAITGESDYFGIWRPPRALLSSIESTLKQAKQNRNYLKSLEIPLPGPSFANQRRTDLSMGNFSKSIYIKTPQSLQSAPRNKFFYEQFN